ncbi:MAG: DUF4333 domain-containing protein [Pseudonocardia sp.]
MNTVHIPPTRPSGTRARRHLMVATLVAAAALSVTGCSFSAHRTVSEAQVEQTLSDRLQEIVGQRPEAIDCPDELDGVVGTALRCALTAGSQRYPVDVTVTSVEGEQINFDFEVAEQPLA